MAFDVALLCALGFHLPCVQNAGFIVLSSFVLNSDVVILDGTQLEVLQVLGQGVSLDG